MRKTKLHSTFNHYITELSSNPDCPIRPRCKAGSLLQLVYQPEDEDIRKIEEFDERVLRNAMTLKESEEAVELPEWLNEVQGWTDLERRRRRKKKKRKKRKRENGGGGDEGEEDGGSLRKRRRKNGGSNGLDPSPSP